MSLEPTYVTRPALPPIEEYISEIRDIWSARMLTNAGPKHQQLSSSLSEYLGVPRASLFANGHLALECAIQALGVTGEVITTPFTFASTTHAIVRSGATPVFCDIDPDSCVIDAEKVESLITERTSAIVPVHVYGNLCDVDRLQQIADKYDLRLIFDAAHAFGVSRDGVGVGNFGDVSMFSFHATKVFNTIEGGALTYQSADFERPFTSWRQFGQVGGENAESVGTNAKMNEFAAAMGICNLRYVDQSIELRRRLSERYQSNLAGIDGLTFNRPQAGVHSNYSYFPVFFDADTFGRTRDEVALALAHQDVYARRYFHPLTSEFAAYKGRFAVSETPVAAVVAERVLTLPLYADLPMAEVDRICDIILKTSGQST